MNPQLRSAIVEARKQSLKLGTLSTNEKNLILATFKKNLESSRSSILAANQKDVQREAPHLSPALLGRLKLDKDKFDVMVASVESVMGLPDPVGRTTLRRELADGLILERKQVPLGVIALIFESRPDVVAQVASLLVKSGNSGVLKGGTEARETNTLIFDTLVHSLSEFESSLGGAFVWISDRTMIREALQDPSLIDLVVPRGSNQLVQDVMSMTKIPVLGHADGVCHVFVDESAKVKESLALVLDAKLQYPSACNSVETLLLHQTVAPRFLELLRASAPPDQLELRGCERTAKLLPDIIPIGDHSWHTEYGEAVLAVKIVRDLKEAIIHINTFGSHHTDTICTEDSAAAQRFEREVDSASVFVNASPRFADGYRYGFGAEIGISTNRTHARGPVGLEGLVTTKYLLHGKYDRVEEFTNKSRQFTHRDMGS